MKKFLLFVMLFVAGVTQLRANDTIVNVTQLFGEEMYICFNKYDRVLVYAPNGCTDFFWEINGQTGSETGTQSPVVIDGNVSIWFRCFFYGCDLGEKGIFIEFINPNIPTETSSTIWKHQGYPTTLESIGSDSLEMYDFHWSTGENTPSIEVTSPGTYTCGISDQCATATRTFIVRDNAEITLATCDLETNHNMVTWLTTPAQAEYVDQVQIKRDGMVINTADYSAGTFIDNIGSDAASRTYTVTAIGTDGVPCPIESHPKETIHMAYLTGINNTIEVNWNAPTGYDLMGFNICEWHEDDGSLNVIDYVGASVTSYTCQESLFDQGYIVVQGVENGKTESRLLSNRSMDLVGLGENEATVFKVYPNPAKDRFIIEGRGTMMVTNSLGQTVLTQEIDGKTTIELPRGLYFVKLGGTMRKVVVE